MKKNFSLKYILILTFLPLIVLFVLGLFLNNYLMMKKDIESSVNEKLEKISTSLKISFKATVNNAIKNYLRGYAQGIKNIIEVYNDLLKQGKYASKRQAVKKITEKIVTHKSKIDEKVFILNVANFPKDIRFVLRPHFKLPKNVYKDLLDKASVNLNGYFEYTFHNKNKFTHKNARSIYFTYSPEWKWLIFVSAIKENVKSLINFQNISNELSSLKIGKSGFIGVINLKGVLLEHPYQEDENVLEQKDLKGKYIFKQMIRRKNGKLKYYWEYGRGIQKKIAYFRYIKEMDLIVFITSPIEEHFEQLKLTRTIVIITLLGFIILIIPVISILSSIIVKPFKEMINTFDHITKKLEFKKVNVKGNKEVSELVRYFNAMIEEIENYSAKLKDSIRKEKEANEELESAYEEIQASYEELESTQEELETTNKELEFSLNKAEEANKLKSEFLAIMSHELRTPLTGMLGFSEILLNDENLSEKQKNYVDFIHSAGNKLLTVLSDLLEISTIEAGKINLNYKNFNIEEVVNDIKILLTEKFKAKNVDFTVELNDIKMIYSDPARIRQILFNLIGNAIKFTDKGEVKLKLKKTDSEYYFEVIDTGIGISKKNKDHIFDMFKQVEGAYKRMYGGVGLGLTICKKLVNALNGNIWVESTINEGSKFTFTIPVYKQVEINDQVYDEMQTQADFNIKKEIKVLFAEDDEINHELIKNVFEDEIYINYNNFYNGLDLLNEFIKNDKYDIIILDIQMPVMNGITCLKEIRKIDNQIPVIALTAFASKEDEKKYLDMGFDDYIPKPITVQNLMYKIYEHVYE